MTVRSVAGVFAASKDNKGNIENTSTYRKLFFGAMCFLKFLTTGTNLNKKEIT